MDEPTFACLLQRFFLERLMSQKNASRHTISSYRDTFRLLLAYAGGRTGKSPSSLAIGDLDGHDHEPCSLETVHHAAAIKPLDRRVRDKGHLPAEAEALQALAGFLQARADLDIVAPVAKTDLNSMHV